MTRVAVLHAYSADNRGDGLLVDETLWQLREALDSDIEIVLAASYPDSFRHLGITTVDAQPTRRGYAREYRALLRSLDDFDLVVAVGGGYLRAGTPTEALKAALVHGPQLRAAGRTSAPTLYMPQSIGPLRGGTRRLVSRLLARIDTVFVRDDRSAVEVARARPVRMPDLALLMPDQTTPDAASVAPRPVLSVRDVRGRIPPPVTALAALMGVFDGFVQSAVGSNDDTEPMRSMGPLRMLAADALLDGREGRRVVVAVRLHAALMALAAGHFVIHLAYERKGFGAFQDVGLDAFVHNVNDFDPRAVHAQVDALLTSADARAEYAAAVSAARGALADRGDALRRTIARLAGADAAGSDASGSAASRTARTKGGRR